MLKPGLKPKSPSELEKVAHLRLLLKNSALHHLIQHRKKPRTIPLQEILAKMRET